MYYVQMDNMKSGGTQLVESRNVIMDTGSTNLMVPADVSVTVPFPMTMLILQFLPAIYRTFNTDRIERTQGDSYILPCVKEPRVNDLVLTFGGLDWPIDYQDIVSVPNSIP